MVSAEYYSEDTKPFLYKRLVKIDTTTGQAWVLQSKVGTQGEIRTWVHWRISNSYLFILQMIQLSL